MVSDVSEDIGRAAAVPVDSASIQTEAVSPVVEGAERPSASIPANPPSAGSGGAGWIFGGIFLLFVMAAIIGSSGNKAPAPSSMSSWEPPPSALPAPAPAPVVSTPAVAPSKGVEKPPVGTDRLLDSAQIRYCLTEKIRVQAIESVVSADRESEIVNFNALVGDYNSRCGQFRYRQDDVDRVQSEIEPKSAELAQVAKTKWVRNALGLDAGGGAGKGAIAAKETAPKKPAIPKNSHLDYFGNDWECARGFRRQADECSAVQVPANAKLDFLGNDWECKRGFRRNWNECVPI